MTGCAISQWDEQLQKIPNFNNFWAQIP